MQGTNRSWEGGESLPCDPGSELRLGGREQKGEDDKWDGNKQKQKQKRTRYDANHRKGDTPRLAPEGLHTAYHLYNAAGQDTLRQQQQSDIR